MQRQRRRGHQRDDGQRREGHQAVPELRRQRAQGRASGWRPRGGGRPGGLFPLTPPPPPPLFPLPSNLWLSARRHLREWKQALKHTPRFLHVGPVSSSRLRFRVPSLAGSPLHVVFPVSRRPPPLQGTRGRFAGRQPAEMEEIPGLAGWTRQAIAVRAWPPETVPVGRLRPPAAVTACFIARQALSPRIGGLTFQAAEVRLS